MDLIENLIELGVTRVDFDMELERTIFEIKLKLKVSVKNINTTISQMIKNVLYGITGNESYVIAAQASGVVVTTGY